MVEVLRHKAAIKRASFSKPIRLAIEHQIIKSDRQLLDYGCGRGDDIRLLSSDGIDCWGWDPGHFSDGELKAADVVNLGYVINVIENPSERIDVLKEAWKLTKSTLIVSTLTTADVKEHRGTPFKDGVLTSIKTFQKYYDQAEIRNWIDSVLGVKSVAASILGVQLIC